MRVLPALVRTLTQVPHISLSHTRRSRTSLSLSHAGLAPSSLLSHTHAGSAPLSLTHTRRSRTSPSHTHTGPAPLSHIHTQALHLSFNLSRRPRTSLSLLILLYMFMSSWYYICECPDTTLYGAGGGAVSICVLILLYICVCARTTIYVCPDTSVHVAGGFACQGWRRRAYSPAGLS